MTNINKTPKFLNGIFSRAACQNCKGPGSFFGGSFMARPGYTFTPLPR